MRTSAAVLSGLWLTVAACGGSGSTSPPYQTVERLSISVSGASIVSGTSVKATATLSNGSPAPNVTWTSSNFNIANVASDGTISGHIAGTAIITATSGTIVGQASVTVVPGAPVSIAIYSGNDQSAAMGSRLAEPLCTNVKDAAGNFIVGAVVTYTVATGGGSMDAPTSPATNASGIAISGLWLLGGVAGTQTVTASSPGVGSVTFTATAR